MIEAQADVKLGEAFRPAALAHSRIYSGGLRSAILPAFALAGAIVASSLVGMLLTLVSLRLEGLVPLLWIAGGILGLMAALKILANSHLKGFLDALRKMGSPPVVSTRFRFDEQGIAVSTDRMSHHAPWSAVAFVIPAPEHWLVQIDTTTLAIPRRAFPDGASEQAFLDLAASQLPKGARLRSVLASQ